jgi:hypothetical protein
MEDVKSSYLFLTLASDGDKWLVSCPNHSTPRRHTNAMYNGWVGYIIGVDTVVEKNPLPKI